MWKCVVCGKITGKHHKKKLTFSNTITAVWTDDKIPMQTLLNNKCPCERILYDPSQQPVVMATVPNLVGFLRDGGGSLFILPQGVKLCRGEEEVRMGRSTTEDQGGDVCTCEATISDVEHEPLLGGFLLLLTDVDRRRSRPSTFFGVLSILQLARLVRFYPILLFLLFWGGREKKLLNIRQLIGF